MTTRAGKQVSSGKRQKTKPSKSPEIPPHNLQHKASPSSTTDQLAYTLPQTRYLFFGGKGGVGKTTAASSAALILLDEADNDERLLLFSTDPAHSLSDSLDQEIGDHLVEVTRGTTEKPPRLFAFEMDAARALNEFKNEHRAVLAEIADRGTMLDETDINDLLDLSLPGMDEVMALFKLSEVLLSDNYTRIIVDTAPTGHTLRMLRLPQVFTRWIAALDRMSEKHRYMVSQFVRGRAPREDDVDLFLNDLTKRVKAVQSMLFDPEQASFVLVTIPEPMAVDETLRYLESLREERVHVAQLLINRLEHAHGDCRFCRARAEAQAPSLKRLEKAFGEFSVRRTPVFAEEVRGVEALRRFAREAWNATARESSEESTSPTSSRRRARTQPTTSPSFSFGSRRLLVFGGKGGVGKTTAVASAALALAENNATSRVLTFSIDPAHSLSDSFDEKIGELKSNVAGLPNLDAMEIDPAHRFETLKERYRAWTDELFESLTGGSRWEIKFDREAMRELVSLAPPGIDEIAALSIISDLVEQDEYSTIVVDTAPTGHLLRFLELPEIALSWVRTFIKLMLKYKNVVRWGVVAEELVALSKSIKRVTSLLTDSRNTEFIGVAIPERMSLAETSRMADSLAELKVPMRRLLLNNVISEEAARKCEFCERRHSAQSAVIEEFRKEFAGRVEILFAPQHPFEIHGTRRLREHFLQWQKL